MWRSVHGASLPGARRSSVLGAQAWAGRRRLQPNRCSGAPRRHGQLYQQARRGHVRPAGAPHLRPGENRPAVRVCVRRARHWGRHHYRRGAWRERHHRAPWRMQPPYCRGGRTGRRPDCRIIGVCNQPGTTRPGRARGLELARTASVATMFNAAPAVPVPPETFALCDYITPNESEASGLTGIPSRRWRTPSGRPTRCWAWACAMS
jgi:hypothetical protein